MLNPKQSCKIALTFSPTGTGKRTGTLMVIDNAEINNAQMVKLVGHGHQGALTISTGTLSFGKQAVNTPSNPKFVKVANRNPIAMSFSAATSGLSGEFAAAQDGVQGLCDLHTDRDGLASGRVDVH
jgi:hypothetical protein